MVSVVTFNTYPSGDSGVFCPDKERMTPFPAFLTRGNASDSFPKIGIVAVSSATTKESSCTFIPFPFSISTF